MSRSFPYSSLSDCDASLKSLTQADGSAKSAAMARNAVLTKPAGALGRLEDLALWFASWQGAARPGLERIQILVFAGNHGVVEDGVSAFPAEVTAAMVENFRAGGAAINQLAETLQADLGVHPIALERPTGNIAKTDAMGEDDCLTALRIGWEAVDPASQLVIPGEMGIGNTTSAAALACHCLGGAAADWVGAGTGVDVAGLARKTAAVENALALHSGATGFDALRRLGGRELAAMAGAVLAARHHSIPVLLDGFIATAAIAPLAKLNPAVLDHCQASHASAEPGHRPMLAAFDLVPILDLGLRLGEASGAAVAAHILRAAVACQSGMASFDEAGVADG